VIDKETKQGELGAALSQLAVKAIMGGLGSADWERYMSVFADNAAQLQLLSHATENEDSYLPRTRAYIVSNSVCAPGTESPTAMGVETQIGNAAPNNVDGTVVSPLADLLP
jgi:hypothetical protein